CRRRHANTSLTLTAANESVGKQTNRRKKLLLHTQRYHNNQRRQISNNKRKGLRNSPKAY
ncbi:hypothetical protein NY813_00005, partial [Escherichia coli]|uniref:hypothetical protein n=1 Tax=Escherichia coli TaxID=562 RepID=UPI0022F072BA